MAKQPAWSDVVEAGLGSREDAIGDPGNRSRLRLPSYPKSSEPPECLLGRLNECVEGLGGWEILQQKQTKGGQTEW